MHDLIIEMKIPSKKLRDGVQREEKAGNFLIDLGGEQRRFVPGKPKSVKRGHVAVLTKKGGGGTHKLQRS